MRTWIARLGIAFLCCTGVTTVEAAESRGDSKTPAVIKSKDKAGREYATKGYIPMKAGPGTKKFQAAGKAASGSLPPKVDMRKYMTKIEDQGETSSCVANAIAGSYEYWVRRDTKQEYDVSRLFVYYNARWRNGDQNEDSGSVIQLAMQGLKEFGACSENRWPFQKPLLLEKPNRDAYQEAAQTKIKEMNQVPNDLTAWKQALASGYPVVFGILLFESFDQANQRGGVVPMPSPEEAGRESHGGHAMTAVGYSDREQVFIVRNSWGDQWGDNGYCYMPYNYVINDKFNGGDSWVFIPENPIVDTEDIWFEDEEPVTDSGRGVEFVINPYTYEDYETVELIWWEEYEIDFNTEIDDEYLQYVEYVEEESWDEIETFDYEEIVETWEEENPGEDSDLYVYDDDSEGDDETEEAIDEISDEEQDAAEIDEDLEENVDEQDEELIDEEIEEESDIEDSGDEALEEDASADEELDEESESYDEEESGEEDTIEEDESVEEEYAEEEEESSDEMEEESSEEEYDESADDSGDDAGYEDEGDSGDTGGDEGDSGGDDGGDSGDGGEE